MFVASPVRVSDDVESLHVTAFVDERQLPNSRLANHAKLRYTVLPFTSVPFKSDGNPQQTANQVRSYHE